MRLWIYYVCIVFIGGFSSQTLGTVTIDHLWDLNALMYTVGTNGIGQSFLAAEPTLTAASFLVTDPYGDGRVWWDDPRVQLFHGLPHTIGPDSVSEAIYTSPHIDIGSLAVSGTHSGRNMYELKIGGSTFTPVPLQVGHVYTLTLTNFGTTGEAFFGDQYPAATDTFSQMVHLYAQPTWNTPLTVGNFAFKVVMAPEPVLLTQIVIAVALLRRRRKVLGG